MEAELWLRPVNCSSAAGCCCAVLQVLFFFNLGPSWYVYLRLFRLAVRCDPRLSFCIPLCAHTGKRVLLAFAQVSMAHQPLQSSTTSRYSQLVTAAPQRTAGLRGRLWGGWRTTVATGAIITSVALVVNVAILIWASKQKPPDGHVGAGVVTLYSGSCTGMSKIFTWSHLALNVVSTLLLSAGAACMQCLSAPTRQEVDRAHSHSTWLDVGIPSVRNLKWIARQRMVLWALLGLSSVPLHLL